MALGAVAGLRVDPRGEVLEVLAERPPELAQLARRLGARGLDLAPQLARGPRDPVLGLLELGPHEEVADLLEALHFAVVLGGSVRAHARYRKVIEIASVKFDVRLGFWSRNQHCQLQVSPGITATGPAGVGTWVRSIAAEYVPAPPVFPTRP